MADFSSGAANDFMDGKGWTGAGRVLTTTSASSITGTQPEPREFLIDGLLPTRTVVLLTGKGGVGKSMLTLQLAECLRTGAAFLGLTTHPCSTLVYSCEDDLPELHRRHASIERSMGQCDDPLGETHFLARDGEDNQLVAFDAAGNLTTTPAFDDLLCTSVHLGARLVVVDTTAQTFGGNENDRAQVTFYVNALRRMAKEIDGTVLLLSHPPKSDAKYSGSTAWDGTVRARCFLAEEEINGEVQRVFVLDKSNYSKRFRKEVVVDEYGVSHAVDEAARTMGEKVAERMAQGKARAAFLDALDRLTAQGRPVSHSERAGNYAPKVMVDAGLNDGCTVKQLATVMNVLLNEGLIRSNEEVGRRSNRAPIYGLKRTTPKAESEPEEEPIEAEEFA
ncbi:AAA family ATPase [Geminicoccus flavidas]|uniref:AAA family ATPase n=1 Tax=Geminicoccus flavidas TaxID=2506407 RepID=UPI0013593D72|nr:AAA family ATPase [Geminicoccus flavidas]